jgi:hypothetical protein
MVYRVSECDSPVALPRGLIDGDGSRDRNLAGDMTCRFIECSVPSTLNTFLPKHQ